MKKTTKKLVLSTVIALISVSPIYASSMELTYDGKKHQYTLPPIALYINNNEVKPEIMPPVQIDGRVLVPAREVFEPLGAAVEWKSYERKIYVSYNESLMILEPDKDEVWLDGETVTLDVPAKIINGKIMVPLRFIGENIGLSVKWVGGDERAVYVAEGSTQPDQGANPTPLPEPTPNPEPTPEPEPTPNPEPLPEEKPESVPTPVLPAVQNKLENAVDGIKQFYQGDSNSLIVDAATAPYNMTTIDRASVVGGRYDALCMIQASTPITGIEVSKSEGKVIIDIANSKNNLGATVQVASNNFVKQMRTSQFNTSTTRVVLDLASGAEALVSLSEDRKEILVQLSQEMVSALAVGEDLKGEYVGIEGFAPSQMQVKEDVEEGQIVVILLNTRLKNDVEWKRIKGDYIDRVYATEVGNNVEITIDMQEGMNFTHTIDMVKGNTLVRIDKPLFEFIEYTGGYSPTFKLTMPGRFDIDDVEVKDLYREKKLIIDLGDNYSEVFSDGVWTINDQTVKSLTVENRTTTRFIIDEQVIKAVNLKQEGDKLVVELVKPKEKYEQIIVLDAGHGGKDGGSSGNGVREKDINLTQTLAIAKYIEQNSDIKIYFTREDDTYPELRDRTNMSNEIEADMFISVHNNSHNATSKGTEVLYYPSTTDTRSKVMAQIALEHILAECGTYNRGIKSRPDLVVLNTSKMPAILLEGAFISNPTEASLLKNETFNANYARAVGNAVIEMFATLSFR
ncbi:MAG: N-acetylmuramoyl-L-alanine amidase family protein [Niameybacter sp.]